MTSAAARNLPELLVHSPGVREGIPLLGGSISRSSGAATELPRALAPPESARAHRSAQMARARRPEARGDPPIAISSCSSCAARPAGVKLRARLPSQRVAAHNLPRHRLALLVSQALCKWVQTSAAAVTHADMVVFAAYLLFAHALLGPVACRVTHSCWPATAKALGLQISKARRPPPLHRRLLLACWHLCCALLVLAAIVCGRAVVAERRSS